MGKWKMVDEILLYDMNENRLPMNEGLYENRLPMNEGL